MFFNDTTMNRTGLSSQVRLLEGIGLSFVLLLSLMLNLAVCTIIWRTKVLRNKPANTFVANLCIANLLLTVCVIPFSLATIIQDKHEAYPRPLCQGNGFISVVSSVAIVMTLCCISLDRYIAVTRPTRYKTIVTVKRACYALLVVWGQGFLYATFPLFGWSKYEYHPGTLHCSPAWTKDCALYIYLAVVGFGFPNVMVFTYIRIFFVIRKHSRKVSTVKRTQKKMKKKDCKLISLTQRLDVKPSLNQNSANEEKSSVEKLNSKEEQTISVSSNMELSSFDSSAKQLELYAKNGKPSGFYVQGGEKSDMSTEFPSYNTISNTGEQSSAPVSHSTSTEPLSNDQQTKRSRMRCREMLRNIWPRKRRREQRPLSREYKVAKTGVLLLLLFIVLWLPYMVVHNCSARVHAPQTVIRMTMWLVFMNGVLNPVAYALCNSSVKMKFEQMFLTIFSLFCKCRRLEGTRANFRISETI